MNSPVNTIRIIGWFIAIVILGRQAIPECRAQSTSPFIPIADMVTVTPQTNGETVSVTVLVELPTPCHFVGNWGQPLQVGNKVYVDAQLSAEAHGYCPQVVVPVSTQYNLGTLPPGNYDFVFESWGTTVKTQSFSVPLVLSIGARQADSQIQLQWNTATSAWYRVEYSSALATNEWAALTAWLPGSGGRFYTNDAVSVGQPQRFYRITTW